MADLFKDIVPAILRTKQKVVTEENEKDYVPYVVNRSLSYHYDCIFYANEMNKVPDTDRLLQFHYLLNTIRSYKRPFQSWQKKEDIDGLAAVKEYYNYSNEKAKEALMVLSNDQLEYIKRSKGGSDDKPQRTRRGNPK